MIFNVGDEVMLTEPVGAMIREGHETKIGEGEPCEVVRLTMSGSLMLRWHPMAPEIVERILGVRGLLFEADPSQVEHRRAA